jgi:hypothetical protein
MSQDADVLLSLSRARVTFQKKKYRFLGSKMDRSNPPRPFQEEKENENRKQTSVKQLLKRKSRKDNDYEKEVDKDQSPPPVPREGNVNEEKEDIVQQPTKKKRKIKQQQQSIHTKDEISFTKDEKSFTKDEKLPPLPSNPEPLPLHYYDVLPIAPYAQKPRSANKKPVHLLKEVIVKGPYDISKVAERRKLQHILNAESTLRRLGVHFAESSIWACPLQYQQNRKPITRLYVTQPQLSPIDPSEWLMEQLSLNDYKQYKGIQTVTVCPRERADVLSASDERADDDISASDEADKGSTNSVSDDQILTKNKSLKTKRVYAQIQKDIVKQESMGLYMLDSKKKIKWNDNPALVVQMLRALIARWLHVPIAIGDSGLWNLLYVPSTNTVYSCGHETRRSPKQCPIDPYGPLFYSSSFTTTKQEHPKLKRWYEYLFSSRTRVCSSKVRQDIEMCIQTHWELIEAMMFNIEARLTLEEQNHWKWRAVCTSIRNVFVDSAPYKDLTIDQKNQKRCALVAPGSTLAKYIFGSNDRHGIIMANGGGAATAATSTAASAGIISGGILSSQTWIHFAIPHLSASAEADRTLLRGGVEKKDHSCNDNHRSGIVLKIYRNTKVPKLVDKSMDEPRVSLFSSSSPASSSSSSSTHTTDDVPLHTLLKSSFITATSPLVSNLFLS